LAVRIGFSKGADGRLAVVHKCVREANLKERQWSTSASVVGSLDDSLKLLIK